MSEVITVQDLETLKKHEIFEAEVITGKVGGLAGGVDISTATNAVTLQVQKTLPQVFADMNYEFDTMVLGMGYTRVGTFAGGGTLDNPRQTLLWESSAGGDGQEYGWTGLFPKVVPPGSTPLTTGGILIGAWVSRFDPLSRNQIKESLARSYAEDGYNLVPGSFEVGGTVSAASDVLMFESDSKGYRWGGPLPKVVPPASTPANSGGLGAAAWSYAEISQVTVPYYTALRAYTGGAKVAYLSGVFGAATPDGAAGYFDHDATDTTSADNGGTIIVGVDGRRWKRVFEGGIQAEWFGAKCDGVNDDAIAINAAMNAAEVAGGGVVQLKAKTYTTKTTILVPGDVTLAGAGRGATWIRSHNSMPKELNTITSKNNPLYTGFSDGVINTGYTYTYNIVIRDLSVDANSIGRDPTASGLTLWMQECGIKLVSAKNCKIINCHVQNALLHAYDVAASAYFDDGDYTHNIAGGSDGVLIEGCTGNNTRYDDIFTIHNSSNVTIRNCRAWNDGTDTAMVWGNNQHGFEVDEGSFGVLVEDCYAEFLMVGFQAKGHDTTMPARNVTFRNCYAKSCAWSFVIDHVDAYSLSPSTQQAKDVVFDRCTSDNAYNDRYQPGVATYKPRAMWLRGYSGVTVRDFTIIGGKGIIELERGVSNVVIDGLTYRGGYTGLNNNSTGVGVVTFVTGAVKGKQVVKNVRILDPISIPVIRCVDTNIVEGIFVQSVHALGSNNTIPCIYTSLLIPSTFEDIKSSGFSSALFHTGAGPTWANYPEGLAFNIRSGIAYLTATGAPVAGTHPQKPGSFYTDFATGKLYAAISTAPTVGGAWTLIS